jgi:prepilin-type N-terminal cleavage/methylation domain-containing protein
MVGNIEQKKSGFTLVEMLVYTAIFCLFMVGITSFINIMNASRRANQAILEVNDQGAAAMRAITRAIRSARSVNAPLQAESSASLSLQTGVEATEPTVISASNGALYITEGDGDPVALTNDKVEISNVSFENLARAATPGTVRARFTLTPISPKGNNYSVDFYGTSSIR